MQSCNCPSHTKETVEFGDFFSENVYNWCTNCGNYGIHAAVKRALVEEKIKPCQTLLCFDIGCHGNGSDKIGGYRFHGLHGRVIPFACGAAVTNRKIKVIAFGGDGGTLGEGINHLIMAIRSNYEVTFILHNNLNYGLTTGQASATTKPSVPMNASPDGITADPIHPMNFVLSLNPGFAARTFSGNIHHMTQTFREAINYKGFSFVEVLQSCPTFNHMTPHEWYQQRIKNVKEIKNYDKHNLKSAIQISQDLENEIAIGTIYENKNIIPFTHRQANRQKIKTELVDEVRSFSVRNFFDSFR